MDEIRVGSASWADPELVKWELFYPKEAKSPEERLRYMRIPRRRRAMSRFRQLHSKSSAE